MQKTIAVAVILFLALPLAFASGKGCNNSSLKGKYTYAFEAKAPGVGVVAAVVGTITFDGHGNLKGTIVQNLGGGQDGPYPFDGVYSVNSDCTYISSFNGSSQFGIIAQGGDKIHVLNTDPGMLLEFTAEKDTEPDKR